MTKIVEFVDFGSRIIARAALGKESDLYLSTTAEVLLKLRFEISQSLARASDTVLSLLAQECEGISGELTNLIVKIKGPPYQVITSRLHQHIMWNFYQNKLENLALKIGDLRVSLSVVLSTLLVYVVQAS